MTRSMLRTDYQIYFFVALPMLNNYGPHMSACVLALQNSSASSTMGVVVSNGASEDIWEEKERERQK